ncbi:MAG: preprotein translocase subunit SecE [Clostridiaceae bacterium]|nr:preprotein translocase subunit SecE [Clostridiaceae bacterium]
MASRKGKKKQDKKEKKPGIGKRIKNFFSDIKAELKRVTWPDRKRLKSNTGTVIAIILLATITIFIFDTVISSVLSGTGFYSYDPKTEITETVDETGEDSDIVVEPETDESEVAPESETDAEDNTDSTE